MRSFNARTSVTTTGMFGGSRDAKSWYGVPCWLGTAIAIDGTLRTPKQKLIIKSNVHYRCPYIHNIIK